MLYGEKKKTLPLPFLNATFFELFPKGDHLVSSNKSHLEKSEISVIIKKNDQIQKSRIKSIARISLTPFYVSMNLWNYESI